MQKKKKSVADTATSKQPGRPEDLWILGKISVNLSYAVNNVSD